MYINLKIVVKYLIIKANNKFNFSNLFSKNSILSFKNKLSFWILGKTYYQMLIFIYDKLLNDIKRMCIYIYIYIYTSKLQ